jgi:uncharacterized protein
MIFFCDVTLGRLAKYLRILGLDTVNLQGPEDFRTVTGSKADFCVFTRHHVVETEGNIVAVRSNSVKEQIQEILPLLRPHLDPNRIMTRCLLCNSVLENVDRTSVEQFVPEFIFHSHQQFRKCPDCMRIFWAGSHVERMKGWLDYILDKDTTQ